VIEPSFFSLFAVDYKRLLPEHLFTHLKMHTFEAVDYVSRLYESSSDFSEAFNAAKSASTQLFYHSHCQQRSLGLAEPTLRLLRDIGFNVLTSTVECCGMAGSFGYKLGYYEISASLGQQLAKQIEIASESGMETVVLASGTSCTEQIHDFTHTKPIHPLVWLESILH